MLKNAAIELQVQFVVINKLVRRCLQKKAQGTQLWYISANFTPIFSVSHGKENMEAKSLFLLFLPDSVPRVFSGEPTIKPAGKG